MDEYPECLNVDEYLEYSRILGMTTYPEYPYVFAYPECPNVNEHLECPSVCRPESWTTKTAVMWIRIERIRIWIHKIWSMRIRIQDKNHQRKKYFQICTLTLELPFFSSDLKNIISYKKNVKLCFSLNFISLDPDPHHCKTGFKIGTYTALVRNIAKP